ncbi:MAG TPA: c-type cytochrome domain-containing protein, partial [Bryobacteraceae bacterium]
MSVPAFAADRGVRFFDTRVAPILTRRCLGCHNDDLKDGGISFLDRASLLQGGSRGPAIVPGKPAASMIVVALRHEGELQMP